ncbi:MAG: protein-L-isoaspartate(D-aspartate) O-methyltransferase [Deltaproteobacteria bacterium]|nr:protein-L-isoaspartate(D-aspartate) O-methyltransferase [Deltaproteobacteria bacterium]
MAVRALRFSFAVFCCGVPASADAGPLDTLETIKARARMVSETIEARGVKDARVLEAMRAVPRHLFVPEVDRAHAYEDRPLPIGLDQTISQPYIVALMTELAEPKAGHRVLEVGTGSGYQAAVLSKLVRSVETIEIVPELAARAREDLRRLGFKNVTVTTGDGYRGLPDRAPFDSIVVTAAPAEVPQPLLDQLAIGGRLVIPVGERAQELLVIERKGKAEYARRSVIPVMFVPMTGEALKR